MKNFEWIFLVSLIFSSCVPSTPQTRIEKNPAKFALLDKKDQNLVRQGQITSGMPPEAVILAWGTPTQRYQGFKNSKLTERWDYAISRPIDITDSYGVYGSGYRPYGSWRNPSLGYGIGPEVAYVPYRVASVWFIDQRVDSWERAQ